MENATKALVMAGAVLIALMIIATLMYAATTWGIIPEKQEDINSAKKLAAFNQQFESFNRSNVYGTDLVSVINRAIENNEIVYNASLNQRFFVNIGFELSDIIGEKKTYRINMTGENVGKVQNVQTESVASFPGGTYYLGTNSRKS